MQQNQTKLTKQTKQNKQIKQSNKTAKQRGSWETELKRLNLKAF